MKKYTTPEERSLLRKMGAFCFLCCLIYFSSYITRKSFNASILAIIKDTATGLTKTDTGLAVTGSFITYGIGQIINGILGDRFSPRIMIPAGLLGAALCNVFIPYALTPVGLCALWCFNGFFQSMIWPPLVRSMSENFTGEFYKKATTLVSVACCVATIGIYLLVSFFVKFFTWQYTFVFCAVMGILSALLWFFIYGKYERAPLIPKTEGSAKEEVEKNVSRPSFWRVVLVSSAIPIAFVVALQGFLRDGIETWMSYFLNDAYSIDTSGAILSVAILPVLSILSYSVGSFFQEKTGCPLTSNLILWCFAGVFSLVLVLFYQSSPIIGIAGVAVLSAASHAINLMLTTRVTIYYKKVGYVSTFSGILNSFTYIGAAIATYGIADITEKYSWTVIMAIFLAISIAGAVATLIALPNWRRFMKD